MCKQKLLTYPGESKRIKSLPNHIHKHALLASTNGEREIHVRSLVMSRNGELSTKSGNEPERRVTNMQSKNQPCILTVTKGRVLPPLQVVRWTPLYRWNAGLACPSYGVHGYSHGIICHPVFRQEAPASAQASGG